MQKSNGKAGAVTLIQRFGGSLNLNVHFHQLFIDGCYELGPRGEPRRFIATEPPSVQELEQVTAQIIKRLTRYLIRQQIIVRDNDTEFQLEIAQEDTFSRLQASSVTYRFATGPSKEKKAMVLKSLNGRMPDGDHFANYGLVAKNSGFSLHAGVATKANEREKLERICRYIARPAVAESRLSINEQGDVVYRFKKPWSDGTTAIKLTQLEMMERLAALVPRPRVHLTRFHGVLGPHYKYRKLIVPKKKPGLTLATAATDNAASAIHPADSDKPLASAKRIAWAQLLKRVFNIDVTVCSRCKGNVKIISAIEDPKVIKKILNHMGLPSSAPILKPARGPPVSDQYDILTQELF